MKEQLNEKLLMAVLKFRLDYRPPRKQQRQKQPPRINFALRVLAAVSVFAVWQSRRRKRIDRLRLL